MEMQVITRSAPLTISRRNFGCPLPDGDADVEEPAAAATSSPAGMSIVTGPSKFVGRGSSGLNRLKMTKLHPLSELHALLFRHLGPFKVPLSYPPHLEMSELSSVICPDMKSLRFSSSLCIEFTSTSTSSRVTWRYKKHEYDEISKYD